MPSAVTFRFRLYVADNLLNSAQARRHLSLLCQTHLAGRHHIEVVDVFSAPQRALDDGVTMTPTLIRLHPLPERRITGALRHAQVTAAALGLETASAA